MSRLSIWGWTDVGRKHEVNDDSVFPQGQWPLPRHIPLFKAQSRGRLLAVADGVSQATRAAQASQAALDALITHYYDEASSEDDIPSALLAAAYKANDAVLALADEDAGHTAMTTLVAAVIHRDRAWIVHAGDSRAYHFTPAAMEALTIDHSMVQELFDAQVITAAEAANHPQQGVLTRALGVSPFTIIEASPPITLHPDSRLLLCSDGLSTLVSEAEMADIALHEPPRRAVHTLINLANHRGGYDNISVVLAGPEYVQTSFTYRLRSLYRRIF